MHTFKKDKYVYFNSQYDKFLQCKLKSQKQLYINSFKIFIKFCALNIDLYGSQL